MPTLLHLDAVLTPSRSLSKAGLWVLLGALGVINLASAALFLSAGAKPVPIFLGLDFLAVLIAFRASYRQARRRERVQVSSDEIHVMHEDGRRSRTVWRSPTAFTRVRVDMRDEPEARVSLHLSGRSLVLAGRLSPRERVDFADALEEAIAAARAERYSP
jgi:uncharacterized membrane protein